MLATVPIIPNLRSHFLRENLILHQGFAAKVHQDSRSG